ncbi:hypothetical protein BMJ31_13080, partial [Sinorhizobium medicae]
MTAIFARTAFHDALKKLNDRQLLRELAYVGGRWVAGREGSSLEVSDPASGASLAFVASIDAAQ